MISLSSSPTLHDNILDIVDQQTGRHLLRTIVADGLEGVLARYLCDCPDLPGYCQACYTIESPYLFAFTTKLYLQILFKWETVHEKAIIHTVYQIRKADAVRFPSTRRLSLNPAPAGAPHNTIEVVPPTSGDDF